MTDANLPVWPAARIETDTFCEGCGYNLYSQAVARDERTGIPLCRCPECGKYAAAGKTVGAERPWLGRLSGLLVVLYVVFLLYCVGGAVAALGAVLDSHLRMGTSNRLLAWDPPARLTSYGSPRQRGPRAEWGYWAASPPVGFAVGMFVATFFWHWPRRRALWAALLPAAVAAFVYWNWSGDVNHWTGAADRWDWLRTWALPVAAAQAAVQSVFLALGVIYGRAVVRGLLRALLPPGPRMVLSFLWFVDGKQPEAGRAAKGGWS